ncbi:MAG: fused MFS/spermidine synthase [Alphaproteobacteria bacterium]|nr:fused MFS/spermidine synthase [Alphaproteobacteria bacterium]QQS56838.1 MAG: fused MFS/spermidine synthase [Alphaproteobacteria bacterium]
MKKDSLSPLLYIIILIEGYIVLSTELLAIRQTIPFVGTGTDTVSIIIAAVLMPLAIGYYTGGRFRPCKIYGNYISLRKKLTFNLILSTVILLPGMSLVFMEWFFQNLLVDIGITSRIVQTSLYATFFVAIPVYFLGQTIPLVSNYFTKTKLSEITGRMLFFSTLGSFLGAVFSTLVLMATIGVHHTVSLTFVLLSIVVILLQRRKLSEPVFLSLSLTVIGLFLNSNHVMSDKSIVYNNQYQMAQILHKGEERHLLLNSNWSSMYDDYGRKYPYIEFAERQGIDPIRNSETPRDILVIGAGAFTLGFEDENNNYIYIDIDPDLLKTAEKYILKDKLKKNKTFLVEEARAFLTRSKREGKKFDVIFLDAYLGGASIPEHLVTQEFFIQIKDSMKNGGILITNFIASPNFADRMSRSIDNTIRSVMPHVSRVVMNEKLLPFNDDANIMANVSYIYRHQEDYDLGVIYTDDKNTVYMDKPQNMLNAFGKK